MAESELFNEQYDATYEYVAVPNTTLLAAFSRTAFALFHRSLPTNLLAVPLVSPSSQVVAVLQMVNKTNPVSNETAPFSAEDTVAAQRICIIAGNLLHRLQMQEAEVRPPPLLVTVTTALKPLLSCSQVQARKRMRQVMDLTRQVSSDSNSDRVVDHLLRFAKETLHAERATLFLVDHARQVWCCCGGCSRQAIYLVLDALPARNWKWYPRKM